MTPKDLQNLLIRPFEIDDNEAGQECLLPTPENDQALPLIIMPPNQTTTALQTITKTCTDMVLQRQQEWYTSPIQISDLSEMQESFCQKIYKIIKDSILKPAYLAFKNNDPKAKEISEAQRLQFAQYIEKLESQEYSHLINPAQIFQLKIIAELLDWTSLEDIKEIKSEVLNTLLRPPQQKEQKDYLL